MPKIVCQDTVFSDIEAVLFDKDGTLEDSRVYLVELAKARISQLLKIAPEISEDLALTFGITDDSLKPQGLMAVGSRQENEIAAASYLASCGYGWYDARKSVSQAFDSATKLVTPNKTNSKLFLGTLELIQSLVNANIKLGIVSADSVAGIKQFVAREKITDYFQVLLGSDVNLSKPNPQLYQKACELLNVNPQKTLMVGDSVGDILMAQKANAKAIFYVHHDNSSNSYTADDVLSIQNLQEIRVIL